MEVKSPPDVKLLRECVDPPIILPFPEAVDSDRLPYLVDFYRDWLAEAGYRLEPCEHLSKGETLQWIHRLLQGEVPVDPKHRGNILINPETCPDCWRRATEEQVEAPLQEAGDMLKRARELLDGAGEAMEADKRFKEGVAWPPGVQRVLKLVGTLLDRLEADIAADKIQLLAGSEREAFGVMCGLEAVKWLLDGIRFMIKEKRFRAYDCLRGGTRMSRILAQKPPDDHPGRLYKDLGVLVPDMELYTNTAHTEWREREELSPDPPDPESRDGRAWVNFFYSESSFSEPFFKDLLESEPDQNRLKSLHTNWKLRQQSLKIANKREEAINKQVLLQSQKYDPEIPDDFFNRDYSHLDFYRQELEEMDAEESSLAVVLSQIDMPQEPGVPETESPESAPADGSPLEAKLKELKGQLREKFQVESFDDVEPLAVVLVFLVDLSLDWLDNHRIYMDLSKNNSPERGAYILTADCAEVAREWIELTGDNTFEKEFEKIEKLARESLEESNGNVGASDLEADWD